MDTRRNLRFSSRLIVPSVPMETRAACHALSDTELYRFVGSEFEAGDITILYYRIAQLTSHSLQQRQEHCDRFIRRKEIKYCRNFIAAFISFQWLRKVISI
ncbi:hypothetical protein C0J52_03527 [Blattella germanica]|nr:hypothetical protein C0J52_03527 [Blattella germanica]